MKTTLYRRISQSYGGLCNTIGKPIVYGSWHVSKVIQRLPTKIIILYNDSLLVCGYRTILVVR